MSTRLLLEGSDIEELLEQIRLEHGDAATIVHAERILSGGIAGFFAKQRYALSVEVPDATDKPRQIEAPAQPEAPAPSALERRAQILERLQEAGVPRDPALSPEQVQAATSAISAALGIDPAPVKAGPLASGALASGTQNPALMLAQDIDEDELTLSSPRRTELTRVTVSPTEMSPTEMTPTEIASTEVSPVADEEAHVREMLTVLRREVAERAEIHVDAAPVAALMASAPESSLTEEEMDSVVVRVPSAALAPWEDETHLPPRAPVGDGQVLLVASEPGLVRRSSQAAARRARVQVEAIIETEDPEFEGFLDAAAARQLGARLTISDQPAVVGISAGLDIIRDDEAAEHLRRVSDALLPTRVWAVVDATRSARINMSWLAQLPRVDALMVVNADLADGPESLLALGYPIATLDGVPASRETWRGLLSRNDWNRH